MVALRAASKMMNSAKFICTRLHRFHKGCIGPLWWQLGLAGGGWGAVGVGALLVAVFLRRVLACGVCLGLWLRGLWMLPVLAVSGVTRTNTQMLIFVCA